MAGHAYRYEEDDDRQLREAPLAEHAEPAGGAPAPAGYAAQSLAEIGVLYDAPGGEAAAAGGPELDQLSLHGVAPEPSQVDPVATAVAQTELERPGAAAAHDEHAQVAESGDAEGPQTGAIQQAPGGARAEPAHDVPSSSVLSGAAQGLSTAVAETPAPGAAQGPAHPLTQAEVHEMLDDPAPAPAAAPAALVAAAPRPAEAPAVAAPTPKAAATPSATANSFLGTDDLKQPGKDRWTSYGKGDRKTHGWDLGGTHGVKNPGGEAGAAIYAVSNVEGRYDSVQTYDAGILSFGIMQWTLHAGSLQKFLGFLKDKSGPEGRAAFQDDFAAKGIDVKPSGGQYQLWYNGKEYPLGADGEGKAAIDKLVREDKATARRWAEIFAAAGADSRVQKAEFERAKEMYQEAQGIKFTDKVVDQSLKACKKTFHAKYRDQYGKAEAWMAASPKAGALFFSMRVNNPRYANAAFLKAIDAFYDAHTTDRTRWPASWGEDFGNLVEAKCKETLSSWHTEGGNEGRVEKTLRFWDKAQQGQAGAPANAAPAPAARPAAPQVAAAPANQGAAADGKLDAARQNKLRAQYAAIMKQFARGKIDQGEAVKAFIVHDQKLHGGTPSLEGLVLLPLLLADLARATLARAAARPDAPARPAPARLDAPRPAQADVKPPASTTDVKLPPTPARPPVAPANVDAAPPHVAGTAISKVLKLPRPLPQVHAFLPPGGAKGSVEVFLFLHGMFAHHDRSHDKGFRPGKDINDPNPDEAMNLAGAMAATTRNLVTLAPVAHFDGEWPLWNELAQNKGFKELIFQSVDQLSSELSITPPLGVGSVSIAGHSGGGSGMGDAAKQLGDLAHDMTYEDAGYADKPGKTGWKESHDKVAAWLLGGDSDKLLRVLVHGPHNVLESTILHSHFNKESLEHTAQVLKKVGVTVTREEGNHDKRTVDSTMYLDHRLHVTGLPGTRTVSVFVLPDETHMELRNRSTQHLITEGRDTEFGTNAAPPTGPLRAAGNLPADPPRSTSPRPRRPTPSRPSRTRITTTHRRSRRARCSRTTRRTATTATTRPAWTRSATRRSAPGAPRRT
jgi:hypothetical protein